MPEGYEAQVVIRWGDPVVAEDAGSTFERLSTVSPSTRWPDF